MVVVREREVLVYMQSVGVGDAHLTACGTAAVGLNDRTATEGG